MTTVTLNQDEYDSPWKEVLDLYFAEFMAFFFPHAYQDVDWSRGYEFLDKELQQVVRDAETGGRRIDKLARVWLKNGEEAWVLIHIEIQGQKDLDFPERMYIYNYRLYDRYRRPIASLAILTDNNANWRPSQFVTELWGSRAGLDFLMVKLVDYKDNWAELENNPNPFAVVVMAHLKTMETRHQPEMRRQWKFSLSKMLYERGYTRRDILELFRFIDWLMGLPPELEHQFQAEIARFEEEQKMQYITTIERLAEQRGRQQGLEQGLEQGTVKTLRENIFDMLELRFASVPAAIVDRLANVDDLSTLRELFKQAVTIESATAFLEILLQYNNQ